MTQLHQHTARVSAADCKEGPEGQEASASYDSVREVLPPQSLDNAFAPSELLTEKERYACNMATD
jgi:hypothetical protein